jgi:hypothetical protein
LILNSTVTPQCYLFIVCIRRALTPIFLPTHTSQSFSKNADLALAFSSDCSDIAAAVDRVSRVSTDLTLSQMTGGYTSTISLVCGVEVKERGGDSNDAIIWLGIWCAIGLSPLRALVERGNGGVRCVNEEI